MVQKSYEESYFGQLRKLVGKEKGQIATARAVVRGEQGRVLDFYDRADEGRWRTDLDLLPGDCELRRFDEKLIERSANRDLQLKANHASVALARKFGYRTEKEYKLIAWYQKSE